MRSSKFGWLAALGLAAVVAACGGGGGSDEPATVTVISQNATVPANKASTSAIAGQTVAFPAVAALGTTGTTTLKVTPSVVGSGASATLGTPTFDISSGGNTASGKMAFGSCIFVIEQSTFPTGHPLAVGGTVTVNPCSIVVLTEDVVVQNDENGNPQSTIVQTPVQVTLGTTPSQPVVIPISINGGVTGGNTAIISLPIPPQFASLLPANTLESFNSLTSGTVQAADRPVTGGG